MIIPVILSGGSGTRLWPLSREAYPKQFLPLTGKNSLFQDTVLRPQAIPDCGAPLVICNDAHRFLVAEQLRQLEVDPFAILLEPVGRNTAPAVAGAAHLVMERDPSALMLVMPSDHILEDIEQFSRCLSAGTKAAQAGKLVTFGIVADRPESGYGYIRRNEEGGDGWYQVREFVEKPDQPTAEEYVASGQYYWNSGMFLFRADALLGELRKFRPDIDDAVSKAVTSRVTDLDFQRLGTEAFFACPSESVDYAVMEKTAEAVVVPLDAGWNDVGAWSALWEVGERDERQNILLGDVIGLDVSDCYLRSEHRLLAAIGLKDVVAVETADAVLIAPKSRVQEVKEVVNRLKATRRTESQDHVRVFRPWGSYETIDECQRFKVKRIIVDPGHSLSLQLHHHRAEHWVVVHGTARVVKGSEELLLTEDQSIYIPLGERHQLSNPGLIPLEIIEVQTGSYLGEDDILRFSDTYGRADAAAQS